MLFWATVLEVFWDFSKGGVLVQPPLAALDMYRQLLCTTTVMIYQLSTVGYVLYRCCIIL